MATNSKPLTEKQFARWRWAMHFCKKVFRCHQMSDRSFFFHGMQFPLCARCTGITAGLVLGGVLFFFLPTLWWLSLLLVLPTVADGILQLKTKWQSNNIRRFVTGFLAGYGTVTFLLQMIKTVIL